MRNNHLNQKASYIQYHWYGYRLQKRQSIIETTSDNRSPEQGSLVLNEYSTFTFHNTEMLAGWIPKALQTKLAQKCVFELTKYVELSKGTLVLRPWGPYEKKRERCLDVKCHFCSHPTPWRKKVEITLHPL